MEKVNVTPSTALQDIYQMQKNLMEFYIKIEGLPPYPLNLNEKASQKIIKDFRGRIVEELSEAYETLLNIWVNENDNTTYNKVQALEAFNEEIADALHFFIETLIFCGIEPEDIQQFLNQTASDNPGTDTFIQEGSVWLTLFRFASHQNLKQTLSFKQINTTTCFRVVDQVVVDTSRPDIAGGRLVSGSVMATHAEFLWEITFMLNKSVAYLKNKEWSQSERSANIVAFKQCILECFLHFIRYMEFMGQNPIGLYTAYYRKNQILQNRIKHGY